MSASHTATATSRRKEPALHADFHINKGGQAAVEFAVGIFALALVIVALTSICSHFITILDLQSEVRVEAASSITGNASSGDSASSLGKHINTEPIREHTRNPGAMERYSQWEIPAVKSARWRSGFRSEPIEIPIFNGQNFDSTQIRIEERASMPVDCGGNNTGGTLW